MARQGKDAQIAAYLEVIAKVNPQIIQEAFMVNMGLPFETVVSATQLEPEKVKALYQGKFV
jgi:fibronectin type 3 domain-containing protein